MKKFFYILTAAIAVLITACTKPETPNPEPTPESYVGYIRSEYPSIKIPGISINDKIVYDLKSAWSYCEGNDSMTELYSDIYTTKDEIFATDIYNPDSSDPAIKYGRLVLPEATISVYSSEIGLYIYEKTFDENEIICRIDSTGENLYKTDNVKSFKFKDASFEAIWSKHEDGILHCHNGICGFDVKVTLKNGNIIEIVYYGASVYNSIIGGIPVHP